MPDRIVIHPGFHKSGTTSLQYCFGKNRKELRANGVTYLESIGRAHHRPAWSLTGRTWGWKDQGGRGTPEKVWRDFAKRVRKSEGTVLISSEFFSEANDDQVLRLQRDLGENPVEVIFTVRPFAKILSSSYQQFLKYGIKLRYEEWLEDIFLHPGVSSKTPSFWRRSSLTDVVTRWTKVFGVSNVSVLLADEKNPRFIFDEFTQVLGLSPGLLKPQEMGGNRSMTTEEIELLLLVNHHFERSRGWDEYWAMIREGYVQYLANKTDALPNAVYLLTPKWAIEEAKKIGESDISELQKLGVKISGDLQSFSDPIVPEGNNEPVATIDLNRVAQLLVSYDFHVIRRFPLRVILRELKRRIRRYRDRKRNGVI